MLVTIILTLEGTAPPYSVVVHMEYIQVYLTPCNISKKTKKWITSTQWKTQEIETQLENGNLGLVNHSTCKFCSRWNSQDRSYTDASGWKVSSRTSGSALGFEVGRWACRNRNDCTCPAQTATAAVGDKIKTVTVTHKVDRLEVFALSAVKLKDKAWEWPVMLL